MEYKILDSLKTSAINNEVESTCELQHKLISNKDKKIISTIRKELSECDEFIISVAFITLGGLTLILEQLKELEKLNIRGKILTGDYLGFTQPKALEKILEFSNVELRLLSEEKFHAKGYFFKKGKIWNFYIGSSNLTMTALTVNFEWNLKVSSLENGKIAKDILKEFNDTFDRLEIIDRERIEQYKILYKSIKDYKKQAAEKVEIKEIIPNLMQKCALENLQKLRYSSNKGLLISATGTGKTYLSAFDIKNVNPKKVLFVAHRKSILEKSRDSYKNILPHYRSYIYEGEKQECEITFAMIQSLSRDKHLMSFKEDEFDYIVIDEVHHGGAKSYQGILNYFKSDFLLGMTATPERSDNFDIFKIFDYNIAYEIRLYDALKEGFLTSFQYFGVAEVKIDGEVISDKSAINKLVCDQRVENIIEKSRFYGYSGEKLHGLIFVSKVEEAKLLARELTFRGINSVALTGDSTDEYREQCIKELENGKINYIISVDIFNEGIDIPCVNQVIMLRPTNSATVYIQQLGRGLRKYKNKEYVVVIDFIGNYEKNFLIPIAISQDSSYNKDDMKNFILNGTDIIPGSSSITFEKIAQERIFENINSSNFSNKKNIEQDFIFLEKQLGRVPFLYDFFENNMIEPTIILKYKKTYDEVLKIMKPGMDFGQISKSENNFLRFLYGIFTPSKRVHEMEVLNYLFQEEKLEVNKFNNYVENKYKLKGQKKNSENAIKHLSKEIFVNLSTCKEYFPIIVKYDDYYIFNGEFTKSYKENNYFKILIDDLIKYNLAYVYKRYNWNEGNGIIRYKQYSKQEAFWYLNLDFNNGYQVSGYTVFEEEKKVLLFITLDPSKEQTFYDNKFFDGYNFSWFSKEKRVISRNGNLTNEGKIAQNYYELQVFIKKKNGENFYYLGEVEKVLSYEEIINEKQNSLVKYILKLKNEIREDIYKYFQLNI